MSKARTVPGENLSSRLAARSSRRARVGARPTFYERLGVADPFDDDAEAEQISRSGMFSYISASNYYRAIRSQRLRMMWRLQAIRHRPVTGERLRAAGPSFAKNRILASAQLPDMGNLTLLDHDVKASGEEEAEEESLFRSRTIGETGATRAVQRSARRSDVELTRALEQIETLLSRSNEPMRQQVREVIREVPSMPAERRVEAVREIVRTVERAPTRARQVPERIASVEPKAAPAPARRSVAARPASVAANRTQAAPAPSERTYDAIQRRLAPVVEQGPAGLQPVLRTSPAIRAVGESAVARMAARPDALEDRGPTVRPTRTTRRSRLEAAPTVAIEHSADEEEVAQPVEVRVAQPPSEPARRRDRAAAPGAHQAPSVTASRARTPRTVPSSRVAESLVKRTLVEPEEGARGLAALGRSTPARRADSVPRAIVRSRAGTTETDVRAPLASSATSWLSDALHEDRRVVRARRAAAPAVRTLAVADELPLLDPVEATSVSKEPAYGQNVEIPVPTSPSQPAAAQPSAPARRARPVRADAEVQQAPAPARERRQAEVPRTRQLIRSLDAAEEREAVPTIVRRLVEPPTLRAAARSVVDEEALAPSPVRPVSRAVSSVVPSALPTLLDPTPDEEEVTAAAPRPTERLAAQVPAPPTRRQTPDVEPTPAVAPRTRQVRAVAPEVPAIVSPPAERPTARVARRARQAVAAEAEAPFSPIATRVTPEPSEAPVRMRGAQMRATTRPAAIDMIALSHSVDEDFEADAPVTRIVPTPPSEPAAARTRRPAPSAGCRRVPVVRGRSESPVRPATTPRFRGVPQICRRWR